MPLVRVARTPYTAAEIQERAIKCPPHFALLRRAARGRHILCFRYCLQAASSRRS